MLLLPESPATPTACIGVFGGSPTWIPAREFPHPLGGSDQPDSRARLPQTPQLGWLLLLQVQDSRPISFPSLLSHMTSMHLNAEVLAMPVTQEKPAPPALRSFQPFSGTVPCDFHILNLRTLQAEVRAPAPWGASPAACLLAPPPCMGGSDCLFPSSQQAQAWGQALCPAVPIPWADESLTLHFMEGGIREVNES